MIGFFHIVWVSRSRGFLKCRVIAAKESDIVRLNERSNQLLVRAHFEAIFRADFLIGLDFRRFYQMYRHFRSSGRNLG